MKKIEAYRLTDGSIVEGHAEATVKQSLIRFSVEITKFANNHGSYAEGKAALYDAIYDNKEELKLIFNSFGGLI